MVAPVESALPSSGGQPHNLRATLETRMFRLGKCFNLQELLFLICSNFVLNLQQLFFLFAVTVLYLQQLLFIASNFFFNLQQLFFIRSNFFICSMSLVGHRNSPAHHILMACVVIE